jgi:WD40 repeat protein
MADPKPTPPPRAPALGAETVAPGCDGLPRETTLPPAAPPGYEILQELGRGGMGVVYQARQLQLGRVVALKMILGGGHAGPGDLARFRSEAQAIARLQHPHIVQIHEVGEHEGLPYFSLEFCPGGSLDRKLAGTPLSPREAANLVEKLARGIHAAHQKGVVHRDLKPANVLLAEDGAPKITDFGLAKKLDEAGQTQSGAVMGTPSYMAPEQASGKTREIGQGADVYALGVILYECLTGRPPFKATTPLDTLLQVVAAEPVAVRQLQPQVPRDLETVCLKCLHKEPHRRYASAAALADDLERFLRGRPVAARPVSRVEKTWRWCRRNPLVSLSLAAVAGAVAAAFLLVTDSRNEAVRLADDNALLAQKERAQGIEAREAGARLQRSQEALRGLLYAANANLIQNAWDANDMPRVHALLKAQLPAEGERDLRGFEWDLWDRRAHAELQTVLVKEAPAGSLIDLSVSPNGTRVVGWALGQGPPIPGRQINVWDAATGKVVLTLTPHEGLFWGGGQPPSFDVTGTRILLTVGPPLGPRNEATFGAWDASTGKRLFLVRDRFEGPIPPRIALSPDGTHLAAYEPLTRSPGGATVRVWDTARGGEPVRFTGPAGRVTSIAFSPDGTDLAAAFAPLSGEQAGGEVRVWSVARGDKRFGVKVPTEVGNLTYIRDGQALAVVQGGWSDWRIGLLDPDSGRVLDGSEWLRAVRPPLENARPVFSPDGRRFAVPGRDGISIRETATGRLLETVRGHPGFYTSVAFCRDGLWLVSTGSDRMVRRWAASGDEPIVIKFPVAPLGKLLFNTAGTRLAAIGSTSGGATPTAVGVWEFTGKQVFAFGHDFGPGIAGEVNVPWVALSADGGRVAASRTVRGAPGVGWHIRSELRVWEADTGKQLFFWKAPDNYVGEISLSPDGHHVAAALGGEGEYPIKIWNLATAQEEKVLPAGAFVRALGYSPDGTRLAAVAGSLKKAPALKVWALATGKEIATVSEPAREEWGAVSTLTFSPDGGRVAWAIGRGGMVMPGEVIVTEIGTGRDLARLKGHAGPVEALAFSPNGRRLVSVELGGMGTEPGNVRIWDATTGDQLLTLRWEGILMRSARFSQDGRRLYTAGLFGLSQGIAIKTWDATPRAAGQP